MFLADFKQLPVKIKDPNSENDWRPYDLFPKKYGSHIVKTIYRGLRMQQWTIASSSKRYTERHFKLRECVELSVKTGSHRGGRLYKHFKR